MTETTGAQVPLTMQGAAFDAFRNRGRSGVLLFATLGYLLLTIVIIGLFVYLNWAGLGAYFGWYVDLVRNTAAPGAKPEDVAAAMAMPPAAVFTLIPTYLLTIFLVYVVLAAYEAACLRWLVHGETGGVFVGLGFGADTWRVWGGYWLWFLMYMAFIICVEILIFLVAGGAFLAAASAGGEPNMANFGVGALIAVVLALVAIALWIWVSVRFAPAAATSILRKRFSFFQAWAVTRGKFWSLFGSFAMLLLLYLVAVIVIGGVGFFVALAGPIASLATAGGTPDPQAALQAFLQPTTLIAAGITYLLILTAAYLFFIGMFGVNARAVLVAKQEGRL